MLCPQRTQKTLRLQWLAALAKAGILPAKIRFLEVTAVQTLKYMFRNNNDDDNLPGLPVPCLILWEPDFGTAKRDICERPVVNTNEFIEVMSHPALDSWLATASQVENGVRLS